jgi:hypothetical protein
MICAWNADDAQMRRTSRPGRRLLAVGGSGWHSRPVPSLFPHHRIAYIPERRIEEYDESNLAAAASGSRLYALALADLHSWFVVHSRRAHPLLDLPCHRQESLLDVGSILRGSFQEGDADAVGEFLFRSAG